MSVAVAQKLVVEQLSHNVRILEMKQLYSCGRMSTDVESILS